MSNVSARGRNALSWSLVPDFVITHRWKFLAIGSTLFWVIWGLLLDTVAGWDLAGGITAAFAVVWLFNLIFVTVFLQFIKVATRWAER